MKRSLSLALLAVCCPLAAAERPAAEPAATVHLGIEHSRALAVPAGSKSASSKPGSGAVEHDGRLIPIHLHIAEDGSSSIECREEHPVRRQPSISLVEPQR